MKIMKSTLENLMLYDGISLINQRLVGVIYHATREWRIVGLVSDDEAEKINKQPKNNEWDFFILDHDAWYDAPFPQNNNILGSSNIPELWYSFRTYQDDLNWTFQKHFEALHSLYDKTRVVEETWPVEIQEYFKRWTGASTGFDSIQGVAVDDRIQDIPIKKTLEETPETTSEETKTIETASIVSLPVFESVDEQDNTCNTQDQFHLFPDSLLEDSLSQVPVIVSENEDHRVTVLHDVQALHVDNPDPQQIDFVRLIDDELLAKTSQIQSVQSNDHLEETDDVQSLPLESNNEGQKALLEEQATAHDHDHDPSEECLPEIRLEAPSEEGDVEVDHEVHQDSTWIVHFDDPRDLQEKNDADREPKQIDSHVEEDVAVNENVVVVINEHPLLGQEEQDLSEIVNTNPYSEEVEPNRESHETMSMNADSLPQTTIEEKEIETYEDHVAEAILQNNQKVPIHLKTTSFSNKKRERRKKNQIDEIA